MHVAGVHILDILETMDTMMRSATLNMRVTPAIKHASEQVLNRIGMSMTEAMELFLRRIIVDQRIPFEIVALDPETFAQLADEIPDQKPLAHRRIHRTKKVRPSRGGG